MAAGYDASREKSSGHRDDDRMEFLKQRYDALKGSTERTNCETNWQEIAEICSPRKLDFVGIRTPGEKRMTKVYDPTGILAVEMLAAGLHGMATNPSAKWFSLRMVGERYGVDQNGESVDINEIPAVQKYMSDVEQIMWARIYAPGTNFTTALHEIYLDLASFGTAVLFCGQQQSGGLLFEARALSECVIAENIDGVVDTVFRCSEYTVRQMIQMERQAGWEVSDKVKEMYRNNQMDEKIKVIHAVYPRADRDYSKRDARNMPFVSCYFEHDACHLLDESGFAEFPYQVARWSKYTSEVYGRSPGMTALPDLKMLQAMVKVKIKLMHKAADPPLFLKDDGVVGQTRTVPGGITYWRGNPNDGVMLHPVSLQGIQAISQDIAMLKEQILRTFYADLMRMTDRANMTATEVVQRTNEMMRLFGPLVGRLESEMLGPLVNRVFGILSREGLLPDPPEEIQGKDFVVEFVSPVATAQKQTEAEAIMQALGIVVQLAGKDLAPQLIQKRIDLDKLITWLWDLFNNDPDLLKSEEDVEQMNEMAQAKQMLDMAGPVAGLLKDGAQGAQALSQVPSNAAAGGVDVAKLMQQFMANVQSDPRAQQEMAALGNGELPPDMDPSQMEPLDTEALIPEMGGA